jgi:hypothetical protein
LPRHAKVVDQRLRVIRLATVAVVAAYGLVAGLYALLAAAAKYGCMSHADGLGCRTSGSILGIVLLGAVIGVVTLVSLLCPSRPARPVLIIGGSGAAALTACLIASVSLLATT